jgi:transposase
MDRASLERFLAQGLSLAEIGRRFDRHPSTVGYWVRKHGLNAAHAWRHAARGGIDESTLEGLCAAGLSMREMAEKLGVSQSAVRYWLGRHQLTVSRARRSPTPTGGPHERTRDLECRRHGRTAFRLEGRGVYRCLRCRNERVSERRRRIKQALVQEAGGSCRICGYDRWIGALQFHHVDPGQKAFGLGQQGMTRSLKAARAEASKCILLCSNCHAEVEAGVVSLPAKR